MGRPWWVDKDKTKLKKLVYSMKVLDGMADDEIAEALCMKSPKIRRCHADYYQWLKNGCPRDPRVKLKNYRRLENVLGIRLDSLRTLHAYRLICTMYDLVPEERICKTLHHMGVDISPRNVGVRYRRIMHAHQDLGIEPDFQVLEDDMMKVGADGYGRELYVKD